MGRSRILFTRLFNGKSYRDREYEIGTATSITKNAANIEVDKVIFRAEIISLEKRDSINPSKDGIINKLPIIRNKNVVKINEMEMKMISSLLLIVSTAIY